MLSQHIAFYTCTQIQYNKGTVPRDFDRLHLESIKWS